MAHEYYVQPNEMHNARLSDILSAPLTAENFDSYADTALDALIRLSDEVVTDYGKSPTVAGDTLRSTETKAFHYFGLNSLEDALDYVAETAQESERLSGVLRRARQVPYVITPPDKDSTPPFVNGSGDYEQPRILPRTKTLLFVLEKDFGIDVSDENRVTILQGEVTPQMMRNTPYNALIIDEIAKLVLVCDEVGNTTYVLDTDSATENGYKIEDLLSMTKPELDQLIASDNANGSKIIYSSQYVHNFIRVINGEEDVSNHIAGQYLNLELISPADLDPEKGYISEYGLSNQLGIGRGALARFVREMGDTLSDPIRCKVGGVIGKYYDSQQQAEIAKYIESIGYRGKPPEDYRSSKSLAVTLGIGREVVAKAAEKLQDKLGDQHLFSFMGKITIGYSVEQQSLIVDYINESLAERLPDNYKTVRAIGIGSDTSPTTIKKVADELAEKNADFGKVEVRDYNGKPSACYSPEQQQMIIDELKSRGLMAPRASDDIMSLTALAKKHGTKLHHVRRAIDDLGADLGEVGIYKIGSVITQGLTAVQIQRISQYLTANKSPMVPEGYMSTAAIAKKYGVADATIASIVSESDEEFGEVGIYQVHSRQAPAYSPEQQRLIEQQLVSRGALRAVPEGYASITALCAELGLNYKTLRKFVDDMADSLGEVKVYKFTSVHAKAYSPEQQAAIKHALEVSEFQAEAPEGYTTIFGLSKVCGVTRSTIQKVIDGIGDQFGEVQRFGTGGNQWNYFSPNQQQMVRTALNR